MMQVAEVEECRYPNLVEPENEPSIMNTELQDLIFALVHLGVYFDLIISLIP